MVLREPATSAKLSHNPNFFLIMYFIGSSNFPIILTNDVHLGLLIRSATLLRVPAAKRFLCSPPCTSLIQVLLAGSYRSFDGRLSVS